MHYVQGCTEYILTPVCVSVLDSGLCLKQLKTVLLDFLMFISMRSSMTLTWISTKLDIHTKMHIALKILLYNNIVFARRCGCWSCT